jgi:hypothetical protein
VYGWYTTAAVPKVVTYNPIYPTRVQFIYEPRGDLLSVYGVDGVGPANKRLSGVLVTVEGASLRGYQLEYSQSSYTGRSLLKKVLEYGRSATLQGTQISGAEVRPNPAIFSYNSTSGARWTSSSNHQLPTHVTYEYYGWDYGVRILDLNGDGLQDVLQSGARENGVGAITTAWINSGTGFSQQKQYATMTDGQPLPLLAQKVDWEADSYPIRQYLVDINGDGLIDIAKMAFAVPQVDKNTVVGYINTGFGWRPLLAQSVSFDQEGNCMGQVVDVNGDQRADCVSRPHLRLGCKSPLWS